MNHAPQRAAAVDAFIDFFEAERNYLEARFYAQYADEIAEYGLPDDIDVPDLDAATDALRSWCTREMMRAYADDRFPGVDRLTDPDVGPDDAPCGSMSAENPWTTRSSPCWPRCRP